MMIMKTFEKSFIKNQSAMEYLMTYGWSILIIAVVLGALSFLGIFNPITFAPKANPGSCQIVKNTQLGISNLVGSCNNQVPQYVAQFSNSLITMNTSNLMNQHFTITLWFYEPSYPNLSGTYPTVGVGNGFVYGVMYLLPTSGDNNGGVTVGNYPNENYLPNPSPPTRVWNFVAATYNGTQISVYRGSNKENYLSYNGPVDYSYSIAVIGGVSGYNELSTGNYLLSNIQIYNTSLTNSSLKALYQEGIGGVPIDLQRLVGWWPLNGDANDYSGNNNNGVPTNVLYISDWYRGYVQP